MLRAVPYRSQTRGLAYGWVLVLVKAYHCMSYHYTKWVVFLGLLPIARSQPGEMKQEICRCLLACDCLLQPPPITTPPLSTVVIIRDSLYERGEADASWARIYQHSSENSAVFFVVTCDGIDEVFLEHLLRYSPVKGCSEVLTIEATIILE